MLTAERIERERARFPVTKRYAYLNHASRGPLSPPAAESVERVAEEMLYCHPSQITGMVEDLDQTRAAVAELIGSGKRSIGLVANTSSGLALAAGSLPVGAGDNIVLRRGEFPANILPWLNLRRRGVEVRWLENRPGGVTVDDLAAVCDGATRIVSLSWVDFADGARIDTAALGGFCREREVRFVVDAIQGVGALEVDLSGIDVLVCGGGKWTLAPQGGGFIYLAPELVEELEPDRLGWLSVVPNADLKLDRLTDYEQPLAPDGRRFEAGSNSLLTQIALGASCNYLADMGAKHIEKRIVELCDYLIEGLTAAGQTITSPRIEGRRSGIVTFSAPEPQTLLQRLLERDIIVSLREGDIRVGVHFYNNRADLDRLIEAL
ncbi:MAG: aminotransferase class V-fold PLP-dependent enzyme [Candidatus Coatesbacteria bacterium]|nr:aminotransferase class V-fold PLP-dependent enzyme [Candidatus Coatesbacteria bacterium]